MVRISRVYAGISSVIRLPWRLGEKAWRKLHPGHAVVGVSLAGYHEKLGGVGNYAISLLRGWPGTLPLATIRLFCSKSTFASAQKLPFRSRIEHRFLPFETDVHEASEECDVVTFFCGHLEPIPPPKGTVFYLADVQEWFFPQYFSEKEHCRRRNLYRSLHAYADALLVSSEFSRRSVIELLGFEPGRVHAVPILCADLPKKGERPPGLLFGPGSFLFFPADDYPHKNHRNVLEALRLLGEEERIPLVCTGSRHSGTDWESLANESGVKLQHLGRIPRSQVRWLFDHARALLFPTQFEGFGIPVLEALECGLPIICSNCSSLPEVAGEAAEYCDPFSPVDIAHAIRRVWFDEGRRGQLLSVAQAQAAKFSPQFVIRRHAETFDQIKNHEVWSPNSSFQLPPINQAQAWKLAGFDAIPDQARIPTFGFSLQHSPLSGPESRVDFFTLVLNGMPFLRRQWEILKSLSGDWHWHVVEGVAELKHDTAWSLKNGGSIPRKFSNRILSDDGSSEFLDGIADEQPRHVTIYRKDRAWEGKLEMCRAPLCNIPAEGGLLWQLDVDEIWAPDTISQVRRTFAQDSNLMAAQFRCRFFVAPDLILDNAGFFGNDDACEWRRVWRFRDGDQWVTHEPPVLTRDGADLFSMKSLSSEQTHKNGWRFDHFAYVLDSQVSFKESYYGYPGALDGWRRMCESRMPEVRPGAFLPWIPAALWATRCKPEDSFSNIPRYA